MTTPATNPAPLALITGASSGIGKATAALLAKRGYRTILTARRTERLAALAAELSVHAPSAAHTLDLEDKPAIKPAIEAMLAAHGPIDLLINNGGHGHCAPMLDLTLDDHHRLMQVHYFAPVAIMQVVLPVMLKRRKGHIINMASMSTKMGPWGHGPYAAAKCAIVSLTQTMAADYANSGVHFSYINPGIICTDFYQNPGYDAIQKQYETHGISVDPVAKAIVRLVDKPKLEVCVPRHYRVVDLIRAISPGWAHKLVTRNSRPKKT